MGPPSQKVLHWLHNVLTSEYRNVERTYSDVAQALANNSWISLRTDVYTFEQGNSSLLLNLSGLLPVTFRGTTYAFPISIWVPRGYPQDATIQFVTPTREMVIRPGQHVSGEGRIYHPYLAGWRHDRSNISEFIAILQDIFAKEPPLVARPRPTAQQLPSQHRNGAPPPIPPLPPNPGRPHGTTVQATSGTAQPPPPPPKPFDAQDGRLEQRSAPPLPPAKVPSFQNVPQSRPRQYFHPESHDRHVQPQNQISLQRDGNAWDGREPLPRSAIANVEHQQNYQPQQDPVSPISPSKQISSFGTWSSDCQSSHGPPYPQQFQASATTSYPPYHQRNGLVSSPQPVNYQQPIPQRDPHRPPMHEQAQRLPKPKPPDDLLTSPFEAPFPLQPTNVVPPPIPRNPQKDGVLSTISHVLGDQVQSIHASNTAAIAPLRAQQAALNTTLQNVNTEISQLKELEKLLSSNEKILHQAMRDADAVLEDARQRQVPDVDEVLFAPTVVARQIYDAVADERAIEDCRTVLMKALDRGRIGSGVWAKQTRSLAREEFLKKALIKKIARGMGLVEEDRWS